MDPRPCFFLSILLAAAPAVEGAEWWNRAWDYRYPVKVDAAGFRSDAASVSFYHGGRAQKDGADIRVTHSSGRLLPHMVLQAGPGDFIRLAFSSEGKTGTFYVYLSNRRAGPAKYDWSPEGGLILETRKFKGGYPGNLHSMRQIAGSSGPSFGKAFVKSVFHGFNVFGPDDAYVSIYEGTIQAPSTGRYVFCTSSDDASFLLVDGKEVVSWPGGHGAVGDTRHNAAVDLDAGAHRFEYLHVNLGGPGIAVAAWQPPGAARIWPIQPNEFGWPAQGDVGRVESRVGSSADFQCEVVEEHEYESGRMAVMVRFKENSENDTDQHEWLFGDGLVGAGGSVSHVYFSEGDYVAALRSGQKEVRNRVRVERRWWRAMKGYSSDAAKFTSVAKRYDYSRLSPRALMDAMDFFAAVEEKGEEYRVAAAALERLDEMTPEAAAKAALVYTDKQRWNDAPKAADLLVKVEKVVEKEPQALASVLLAEGDVYFYFLHDNIRALEVYDRIVSRFAGRLKEHTVRIAKIRIGDVYRKEARYEEAQRAYSDAERLKIYKWPEDRLAVRKGALFAEVEQALKADDIETARETLDTLEWEFPGERLRGESSLLRGRLALKQKNYHEAEKQFMDLVNVNPRSPYAADCLHSAALALEAMGNQEEAGKVRERLAAEYPESPHAQ